MEDVKINVEEQAEKLRKVAEESAEDFSEITDEQLDGISGGVKDHEISDGIGVLRDRR